MIQQKLIQLGLNEAYANIVTRYLVEAEAAGVFSHGIMRLPSIISHLQAGGRNGPGSFYSIAPTIYRYDAQGELGIVALHKAAEKCVEVANENYSSIMSVTGYVGTTGALGAFTRFLAEQGVIAIACCGSAYSVAPYGGAQAILGTNPIAIAFPAEKQTFSADFATSAWSYGNLKLAMNEGRAIPLGVVQDAQGNPSTDPHDADAGSQLPMAGHKGYALGLAVELLAGPLLGAKAGRTAVSGSDGALFICLRSDTFRPQSFVMREAQQLFDEIKTSPLAPRSAEIRIPGEGTTEKSNKSEEMVLVDVQALAECGISVG